MYLQLDGAAKAFGDPFLTTGRQSYFAWLNELVTTSMPGVRRLWAEVYRSRPDLRKVFPDALNSQAAALCNRMVSSGQTECGLTEALQPTTSPLKQG